MRKLFSTATIYTGLVISMAAQALTPGNIVVLRVGDGSTALSSAAAQVSLIEYSTAGAATGNILNFPSGATGVRLTQSGSATSEGHISVSQDGNYITVAGYDAPAATTGVASGTDNLTIGTVPVANIGTYTTNHQFLRTSAYTGNNFRSVVTSNGTSYWGSGPSGGSGGVRFMNTTGAPVAGTQVSATVQNTRDVQIFGNQLYVSSNSSTFRVCTVGTGLPTTTGNTIANLPGANIASLTDPYTFVMFDRNPAILGFDALYVANNGTGAGTGVIKFYFDGTNWINAGEIRGTSGVFATRLSGYVNCNNAVELFIGTGPSGSRVNTIYKFTDAAAYNATMTSNGSNISAVATSIITAGANYLFGGIAVVPNPKLVITSNTTVPAGTYGDIFITSGATATLSGNITIAGTLTVSSGCTLDAGTYVISSTSTATGTPGGVFMLEAGSTLKTAHASGITLSGATGTVQTCIRNYSPAANYHYTGTALQVTGNGLPGTITGSLTINNSSGMAGTGVSLSQAVNISSPGIITLTNGKLTTTSTNLLTVSNAVNTSLVGGSASSFISGPLRRYVNSGLFNYPLPLGKGTFYGSANLSAATAASDFTIEYFNTQAPQPTYDFTLKDPTLDHISPCQYWVISLTGGATTAYVTLSWDAVNSCGGVTNLSDLRVAHWTGALWHDEGNGLTTGTTTAGTITTAAPLSSFSPFTLSSITTQNPLPIELVSYTGACNTGHVVLEWSTASETNNQYFTIHKSVDGINYYEIGQVNGAGNSNSLTHYQFADLEKMGGGNYYRLSQTDFNGQTTTFNPVHVSCDAIIETSSYIISSGREQVQLSFSSPADDQVNIHLLDNLGRSMGIWNKPVSVGTNVLTLSPGITSSGIYILQVSAKNWVRSFKIFIP